MKKRLMAALLCLCLLIGLCTAAAFASETEPDTNDTIVGDDNTNTDDDNLEIDGDSPIEMPSTGAEGNWVIADTVASTMGGNYAEFDADANAAYSRGIDIYAQAFDNAVANADHVYKVEIVWGDMKFAWGSTDQIVRTWQPDTHSYTSNEDSREEKWYLVNEGAELTKLEYDANGTYAGVLTGTAQNYVVMFNHSDQPVNANVQIIDIYNEADDADNQDNIVPSLTPVESFGTSGTQAQDGSFDFELDYDAETGVIYSTENGTAAAAYVSLSEAPADGVLNTTTDTTVARITIKLSIPQQTEPDIDEGGSQD